MMFTCKGTSILSLCIPGNKKYMGKTESDISIKHLLEKLHIDTIAHCMFVKSKGGKNGNSDYWILDTN